SIQISGYSEGTDYTISQNENGFVVTFNNMVDKKFNLSYSTEFDYDAREDKSVNKLPNRVKLDWNDSDNDAQTISVEKKFVPASYTQQNGFKSGSYNAVSKEITWSVGLNYNLQTYAEPAVVDYIQGNQQLLEDSITVYEMKLNSGSNDVEKGNVLQAGTDYELNMVTSPSDESGFKISFPEDNNTPYLVEYKTSLKDLLIEKEYNNTATVLNNEKEVTTLDAKVSVLNGGEYTDKSGEQKGEKIEWTVNLN
ncbi:collagen binding domain-containing protein, partial [Anaerobacillus sp. 1_MG-2023]|uniref:collagen binding domain-containing protein n=1 Tax=Anaerobacillus sp. 1_MG-2023 TaxID=3062655 RepID=UPI0026E1E56F